MTAKPFLKWAGGKRQLLPELLTNLPAAWVEQRERVYHEPFVGGGAFFFALVGGPHCPPAHAILSDNNARLVRTYKAVRDDVEAVIEKLASCPYDKDFFYKMRGRKIDDEADDAVAAWFIYMNRAGFNGLYRVNKQGGFNVPFGRYTNPLICDADNLRACSQALQGVRLVHRSFEESMMEAERGDFVYCDPPYVPLKATSNFTSYTADGFGDAHQVRLRDAALELRGRGVHVLLSNSSAPRVRELYKDFSVTEVSARRAVNSKADRRGALTELLIW